MLPGRDRPGIISFGPKANAFIPQGMRIEGILAEGSVVIA